MYNKDGKESLAGIHSRPKWPWLRSNVITLTELTEDFQIHPNQISEWKQLLQDSAARRMRSRPGFDINVMARQYRAIDTGK